MPNTKYSAENKDSSKNLWIRSMYAVLAGLTLSILMGLDVRQALFLIVLIEGAYVLWLMRRFGVWNRASDRPKSAIKNTNSLVDKDVDVSLEELLSSNSPLSNAEAKTWLDRMLNRQQNDK